MLNINLIFNINLYMIRPKEYWWLAQLALSQFLVPPKNGTFEFFPYLSSTKNSKDTEKLLPSNAFGYTFCNFAQIWWGKCQKQIWALVSGDSTIERGSWTAELSSIAQAAAKCVCLLLKLIERQTGKRRIRYNSGCSSQPSTQYTVPTHPR